MILDRSAARILLPIRPETEPKWTFGRAMLVCGSLSMSGAALLSAKAALRSGVGLAQLASVPEVIAAARVALPEALLLQTARQKEDIPGAIHMDSAFPILDQAKKASCLLYGCGCGVTAHGWKLLRSLILNYEGRLILDADGLNQLAEEPSLLYNVKNMPILTPHIGEFCRLSGLTRQQVQYDPASAAMDFARKYRCVVALKGAKTCVTDGDRLFTVEAPNSGMAKGGSGDVLAGLCVGLCAQMPDKPLESAALAVWLHQRAGALVRETLGARAMLPGDVLCCIPKAFLELE